MSFRRLWKAVPPNRSVEPAPRKTVRIHGRCESPFTKRIYRHGIQQPRVSVTDRRRRTSSPASSMAASSQAQSPIAGGSICTPQSGNASQGAFSSGTMSIGSIIEPNIRRALSQHDQHWTQPYQMPITMAPRGYPPELVFGLSASDDSPFYSSDSCYSPISEAAQSHPGSQSYLPRYDKSRAPSSAYMPDYSTQLTTPISAASSFGPWSGLEGTSQPVDGLGIGFEGQYHHSVGISRYASMTHEHPVDSLLDKTPTASSFMERTRGTSLRAESSFATGLVASKNRLVNLNDETLQHYLQCYWKYFDPQFPIIHRPSPVTETSSVLNTILLAIGAQFSNRPFARSHSMSWFIFATRSCATVRLSSYPFEFCANDV